MEMILKRQVHLPHIKYFVLFNIWPKGHQEPCDTPNVIQQVERAALRVLLVDLLWINFNLSTLVFLYTFLEGQGTKLEFFYPFLVLSMF